MDDTEKEGMVLEEGAGEEGSSRWGSHALQDGPLGHRGCNDQEGRRLRA